MPGNAVRAIAHWRPGNDQSALQLVMADFAKAIAQVHWRNRSWLVVSGTAAQLPRGHHIRAQPMAQEHGQRVHLLDSPAAANTSLEGRAQRGSADGCTPGTGVWF